MSGSEAEERIRLKAEAKLRRSWPGARIIHELVLEQWGVRLDLAAVTTDRLILVEIKSERDVLDRLRRQLDAALPVAVEVWLCVADKHVAKIEKLRDNVLRDCPREVKTKWGSATYYDPNPDHIAALDSVVIMAETDHGFRVVHQPWERNRLLDPRALLWMLWAAELQQLARIGALPRRRCIEACLEHLTGRQIRRGVYAALRARPFPRADTARLEGEPFALEAQRS